MADKRNDNIPPESLEEQALHIARRKGNEGGDVRADDQAQAREELEETTRPPPESDPKHRKRKEP